MGADSQRGGGGQSSLGSVLTYPSVSPAFSGVDHPPLRQLAE
ncbi:MAG TPA: hypothetical protein VJC05_00040 [Candidatus Andersenbacteria bacterium]|nr:hypothetical protein [Candidatus Andersenbacteria bacterium]